MLRFFFWNLRTTPPPSTDYITFGKMAFQVPHPHNDFRDLQNFWEILCWKSITLTPWRNMWEIWKNMLKMWKVWRNLSEIWRNMSKMWKNMKKYVRYIGFRTAHIGSGTRKISELQLKLWDFEKFWASPHIGYKFRSLPFHVGTGTWKNHFYFFPPPQLVFLDFLIIGAAHLSNIICTAAKPPILTSYGCIMATPLFWGAVSRVIIH